MTCRLITALVVLGCWGGPGIHSILAQSRPSPSELLQELQSEQTTDRARDELLRFGKSDPAVREYLAVHLPPLIESGPSIETCPGYPCQTWRNAVELAGNLKIAETAPALARWIIVKDINPWPGIGPYGAKLEIDPTAIALSSIGDPAIPALRHVLDSGSPDEHTLAVRALCTIGTPKAKAVAFGQSETTRRPPNTPYSTIQKLLRAAFPDVAPTSFLALTIVSSFDRVPGPVGNLSFQVTDVSPGNEQYLGGNEEHPGRIRRPQILMDGICLFDRFGTLQQLFIHSDSLTSGQKHEALRTLANSHPEWTNAQAIQALTEAGAEYGPWNKDAFLKSLPVKGIGDALGGQLAIESADFDSLSATREGDFASFHWAVVFRIQEPSDKTVQYKAIFEPFGGRLTWLGKSLTL